MTMEGTEARYVYGITRRGVATPLPAGIDGQDVGRVEHGQLTALVSEAPDGPVKASRRNLLAHTEVLQQAVAEQCVLPMRFGVVMPSEAAVADHLLAAHEDSLGEQLGVFDDLVELDLKVVCPEDVLLRTIVSERPDLVKLRESIRGRPDDATYFDRLRLGELISEAVEQKRAALVRHVVGRLEPDALSTEVGEPAHEHMLVNVAFLVERGGLENFDREVAALDRELGDDLRFKYVGPLPPFHFVETAAGSEAWA
jgi:hypothetical protein